MTPATEKFLFDLDFTDPSTIDEQLRAKAEAQAAEQERLRQEQEAAERAAAGEPEPVEPEAEEESIPEEPPAPTFSEEELAAAKQESFEAGRQQGMKEGSDNIENATLQALTTIQQQMESAWKRQADAANRAHKDSISVAAALVGKVLPSYAIKGGIDEITNLVGTIMERMHSEPRLMIHVAPDLETTIRDQIETLAKRAGFDGRAIVKPQEGLGPSDCKVHWTDGGAERSADHLWQDIEAIVSEHLGEPPTLPTGDAIAEPEPELEVAQQAAAETAVEPEAGLEPGPTGQADHETQSAEPDPSIEDQAPGSETPEDQ